MENIEKVRCLIIGSGPAGYTAAIYAGRANLVPVLFQGMSPGGQLTKTSDIENFPGYPQGISGFDLMEDLRNQALRFNTDIRYGTITAVDLSAAPYSIVIDGEKTIKTETLIISTGATAKYLGLPDEAKYASSGVSACAICDGFFYRGKNVAVVGGGDTACEDAMYLSEICKKVYMIVRKHHLRASKILQKRVFENKKIEILFEHEVVSLFGEHALDGAVLVKRKGKKDEGKEVIDIDGLFLAIGHHPNSEIFKPYLEVDEIGYIKTLHGTPKTKIPGVFVAGDVGDPIYRQAITAAGSGCKAAIEAERYLIENGL